MINVDTEFYRSRDSLDQSSVERTCDLVQLHCKTGGAVVTKYVLLSKLCVLEYMQ